MLKRELSFLFVFKYFFARFMIVWCRVLLLSVFFCHTRFRVDFYRERFRDYLCRKSNSLAAPSVGKRPKHIECYSYVTSDEEPSLKSSIFFGDSDFNPLLKLKEHQPNQRPACSWFRFHVWVQLCLVCTPRCTLKQSKPINFKSQF